MTRNQLRKLLIDEVKIGCEFRINTIDNKKGSITLELPNEYRTYGRNSFDYYDYDDISNKEFNRQETKKAKLKKFILDILEKFKKFGFELGETDVFTINFYLPEKYKTEKIKTLSDIYGELKDYIRKPKFIQNYEEC